MILLKKIYIYITRWNLHIYVREINYIILCSLEIIQFLFESFLFLFFSYNLYNLRVFRIYKLKLYEYPV